MAERGLSSVNLESMEESLHRLSKKPGVKAWLMLDRSNGTLLKTSGQIAAIRPPKSTPTTTQQPQQAQPTPGASFSSDAGAEIDNETQAAQQLARMVYSFVAASGSFVDEIDTEDELKLLRLRTRKQEFVIVPEPKYLLVVIHDTPPA
ncbi:hypothetical protein GGR57DRAFT_507752 [Xylariaceae sp. FL1272]|nr:hypothetical protein GGR57DRAFT_507752 [Xylariaceae sp. FL1272]